MLKHLKKLFRKKTPDAPRHISKLSKKEKEGLVKFQFRVTGKLVWTEPLRAERLNSLAHETLNKRNLKIVAYGDISHRPIENTAFEAFYRDYFVKE